MFGTITFFSKKGFGFIRPSDPNAEDVFFHCREFDGHESKLVKGAKIEFSLGSNKGRPQARDIRLIVDVQDDVAATTTTNGGK